MTSRAIAASMMRIWQRHPRRNFAFKKRGILMTACGDYLVFGEHVDKDTGKVTRLLDAANFCRDRLCPMCQWRKSLVTFVQLSSIMDEIDREKPGELVPIFLTVTMRNVKSFCLENGITHILKSWSRMTTKTTAPDFRNHVKGWFRALEVTYNAETDEWHPHIHAVLLVPSRYFSDYKIYIDHDEWVARWRRAMRVNYDPSVDVRSISENRADAVAELSKYAVKPGEWVSANRDVTDEHVELLATVLKNRRLIGFGGVMLATRKALRQIDAERADLVRTGDDERIRGDVRIALDRYEWQAGITNDYVLVRRDEFEKIRSVE